MTQNISYEFEILAVKESLFGIITRLIIYECIFTHTYRKIIFGFSSKKWEGKVLYPLHYHAFVVYVRILVLK